MPAIHDRKSRRLPAAIFRAPCATWSIGSDLLPEISNRELIDLLKRWIKELSPALEEAIACHVNLIECGYRNHPSDEQLRGSDCSDQDLQLILKRYRLPDNSAAYRKLVSLSVHRLRTKLEKHRRSLNADDWRPGWPITRTPPVARSTR